MSHSGKKDSKDKPVNIFEKFKKEFSNERGLSCEGQVGTGDLPQVVAGSNITNDSNSLLSNSDFQTLINSGTLPVTNAQVPRSHQQLPTTSTLATNTVPLQSFNMNLPITEIDLLNMININCANQTSLQSYVNIPTTSTIVPPSPSLAPEPNLPDDHSDDDSVENKDFTVICDKATPAITQQLPLVVNTLPHIIPTIQTNQDIAITPSIPTQGTTAATESQPIVRLLSLTFAKLHCLARYSR
jgi:hypothetical protein